MFKIIHILWCASLLLGVSSSDSVAQLTEHHLGDSVTSQQATQELFSDLDINGNGRISETELFEVSHWIKLLIYIILHVKRFLLSFKSTKPTFFPSCLRRKLVLPFSVSVVVLLEVVSFYSLLDIFCSCQPTLRHNDCSPRYLQHSELS